MDYCTQSQLYMLTILSAHNVLRGGCMSIKEVDDLKRVFRDYPWIRDDFTEDRAISDHRIISHLYQIDHLRNEVRTDETPPLVYTEWLAISCLLNNGNPPTSVED